MARKTDIRLRRSNTAGAIPSGSHLNEGELAINTADGALYFRKSDSTIITAHDNTIMHIDSGNDRVGIGTTSPAFKLDVQVANGNTLARFKDSDSSHSGIVIAGDANAGWVGNDIGVTGEGIYYQSSDNLMRFYTNSTERIRIVSDGKVGIGTVSPSFKLSVDSGTSDYPGYFKSTDNKAAIIIEDDDTTIYVSAENDRASLGHNPGLHANNLNVMNTGYVGIGTSSPARRLTVQGSSGDNLPARFIGGANTTHGSIEFQDPTTTADYKVVIGSKSDDLYFQSGGNEKARLTSGGFLGIGNSAPSSKLHVSGGDILIDNNNSLSFENVAGAKRDILTYNSSNKVRLDNPGGSTVDLNSDTLIVHRHGRIVTGKAGQSWTNGYSRNISIQNITDSSNNGFGVWNAFIGTNLRYDTSNNTFVRASDQGNSNWGNIAAQFFNGAAGNTDPAIDWVTDIANDSVSDGSEVNVSGSTLVGLSKMTLTSGGSLGIGTRSPDGELHILGTGSGNGDIYVERTSGAKIHLQAQSADGKIGTISNHNLGLNTNGATRATIDTNGRFGIGVIPGYKLHISGTTNNNDLVIQNSTHGGSLRLQANTNFMGMFSTSSKPLYFGTNNDADQMVLDTDGQLGLGTTSPDANLDIESNLPTIRLTETDDSTYSEISQSFGYLTINNDAGNSGSGDAIIFKVDNSEKVRFESGGGVLIGNTTNFSDANANDLQVGNTTGAHGISIMSNNSHNGNLFFGDNDNNDAGRVSYNHTNNRMEFYTNRTQQLVIDSAGNVGINEQPRFKLSVKTPGIPSGSTYAWPLDLSRPNTENRGLTFGIAASGTTNAIAGHNADVSIGHTYGTDSNGLPQYYETLRVQHIDQSVGRVGIGTTAPVSLLHIKGSGTYNHTPTNPQGADFVITSSEMSDNNYHSIMQLVSVRQSLSTGNGANGYLGFTTMDDSNAQGVNDAGRIAIVNETGTSRNSATALSFWTNSGGTYDNAAEEHMRITSAGNTIFGGTSVGAAGAMSVKVDGSYTDLYLYGAGTSQGGRIFFGDSSDRSSITGTYGTGGGGKLSFKTDTTGGTSQDRLVIDSDGSIRFNNAFTFPTSIGSAGQILKVPSSGSTLIWANDAGGGSATVLTDNDGDTKIQVEESADEDIIRFDTAGTQRMVITDAGRIGVNTQSPVAMLHVNGGIVAVGDGTNTTYYEEDKIHSYATSGFTIDGREGITLETTSDDKDITFKINDSVNGLQTYMTVDGGEERVVFNKWTRHVDNARILIGTGGDLSLYHDGTNSYIQSTTGTFNLTTDGGNEFALTAVNNGAVSLFYNGSAKLATKSDGVDITGELQSDSLDVDGNADISGNLVVGGDLTVQGTTTTLNTATLDVEDKNITLNYGSGDTSGSANGAGITIQDAVNGTTDATILWDATNDEFDFSHPIKVAGSLGVTNIVTNKVVKFNGSILDDSNIIDDGSTITLGSNTVINGTSNLNGGVSVNVDSSSTSFGNHQAALRIDNTNTTANNWASLVFDSNNGSSAEVSARFTDHTNNYADLYFANRGSGGYTTKMFISQDGSVGVGTTSPSSLLTVHNSSTAGNTQLHVHNNKTGDAAVLRLEGGRTSANDAAQVLLANGGYIGSAIKMHSSGSQEGDMRFYVSGASSGNSLSEAMRIGTNGAVGIGTSTPNYKLHVKETGVNAGAIYAEDGTSWLRVVPNLGGSGFNPMSAAGDIGLIFSNDNDSTTNSSTLGLLIAPHSTSASGIKILEDGRVGIGTTTPNSRFTVNVGSQGDGIELQSSEVSIAKLSRTVYGSTVVASLDGVAGRPIHIGGIVNEDVLLANAGGNVGIGTSSPSTKLEVVGGSIQLTNGTSGTYIKAVQTTNSSNAGFYMASGSSNWYTLVDTSGKYQIYDGDAAAIRVIVDGTGSVGIGVNAPGRKLSVGGAIELTTADTTVHTGHAAIRRGSSGEMFLDAPGDIHVNLDTNNNNTDRAFRIRTNANTTDLFTVNESGNATLSGNLETTSYLSSSAGAYFNTNTGSNPVYITRSGNTDQALKIYTDDANVIFESIQDESLDNYGGFIFAMDSGTTHPFFDVRKGTASSGTKFRVDGSGHVGINEANPDSRLHITGTDGSWDKHITIEHNSSDIGKILVDTDGMKFRNMSSGNGFYFRDSANATQMVIDSSGQVGIGVGSSPGQKLDVGGIIRSKAVNPQVRIYTSSGTGTGYLVYGDSADDDVGQIYYSHANNEMGFVVNGGSAKMLINSSGNVGVGVTSIPSWANFMTNGTVAVGGILYVKQDQKIQALTAYPGGAGYLRINPDGGNVGIGMGSSTPKAKLQVEEYGIDTSETSTSATTQVTIHSFPIADFRTARFTIQITNTTDSTYHSTEIIAVHDGTTANITEFGEVHTGSSVEATFDADISSNNFRLRATPTSTNSMEFKVVCHSITV